MHADDAPKVDPVSRELEYGHPTETVAHRGEAAVDERLRCQHVDASLGPVPKPPRIGSKVGDAREDALAISCNAVSVHVTREHHVPEVRETARAALSMRIEAGAPMNHQDPRAAVAPRLVTHEGAGQSGVPISVANSCMSQ